MIMPRGQQLLLPASPLFVFGSLAVALLVSMALGIGWSGRAAWMPDLLSIVLVFWCVHQPRKVGIGVAFVLGLIVDVHETSLLGQHALVYTVLGYLAVMIHRRLLWFSVPSQALQVWPLFLASHLLTLAVRALLGGAFPGWSLFLAPVLEAVLWPVFSVVLLAPQRRAPDPDADRPL